MSAGMNGTVRAVVRMGIYVGAKVYFIHEVRTRDTIILLPLDPSFYNLVIIAAFYLIANVKM